MGTTAATRETFEPRAGAGTGELIGAGRSGAVFKDRDEEGRTVARKVFDSDALTKLVQVVFLGAPNPYAWNEHAVQAAVLRRRILAPLVRHWFGERLRVAAAWSQDWNRDALAYQLHTEFIAGRAPTLHHPLNRRGALEVHDLWNGVMKPLQERLVESGFVGLVWQAGLGNPVALANFLLVSSAEGEGLRWAWIDLESGVPALFPANVLELFRFYLPQCVRFGRPLFDDVDLDRLRTYVSERHAELEVGLGRATLAEIERDVDSLRFHQDEWKSERRIERSIRYRLKKQGITADEARYYQAHPLRWYAREAARVPPALVRKLRRVLAKLAGWGERLPWRELPRSGLRFLTSQAYRQRIACALVGGRIDSWERRRQLSKDEVELLKGHLASEESSAYVTDFGVHVSIKPIVKTIEWIVLPTLFAFGLIGPATLAVGIALGGSVGRTAYTLGRLLQSAATGRERPWIALGVGLLPVVGNLAYPAQLLFSSTVEDDYLAQFMLYDGCTAFGRKLPIFGGRDTLTEHLFNRFPDLLVRGR